MIPILKFANEILGGNARNYLVIRMLCALNLFLN